jgi:hypothetical protein
VRGVGADDAGPYRLLVRVTDPRPESRERTIAVGDTIGEAIDPYGDVDEFSFAGAAGEELIVFFQALEEQPVANLMLTLTDSTTHDQLRILGSAGRADALEDESTGRLLLPSTGRYVMHIEGASYFSYGPKNGRGPYRFFVYPVHRAPEDSPATVTIGDTVTESIGAVGDIDEFTFDGTAGEEVNVNLQILAGLSSGVWLEVRHGQSQDAAVTTRVPGALDNNGTGRFTLPVTGAYTVRLSGAEAGAPDSTTGRYRFEIYRVDRRPEDTSATVSIGDTVTGESIDRPGDVDEFRFTGLSGEQLQVFFNLVDPGGSKKLRLDVIAAGGTTTVGTESVGLPGEYSPAFQLGATGRFTMPTAGTYTLRVYGLDVSVGAYTVELYHVDPAPEVAAAEVPLGVWVTGESLDRPGDVDTYTVDATSGQRLIMRVVAAPGSPDGFYLLSEIPYWQTSSGQYASHRYTIPETKTYPLRVVGDLLGQSEYGVGPYELMVYASDPAPETASAAYTVGDTVVNEAIDLAGDIDEFTFAATAGDTLDVYFDAMDGSVERDFVLIVENARTGESIFGAGTSGLGGNAGTFVVPSTDSYRVMIDNLRTAMTGDVDPSAVGPYRFAITSHQP